jgi:Zn2+/Cd2+-exporting ATPase
MVEKELKITGLDCLECSKGLEASIAAMPDVEEARLQFFDGILRLRGDVDESELRKRIAQLGYSVEDDQESTLNPADEPNALLGFWRFILQQTETQLALISGGIVLISLVFAWVGLPNWVTIGLQMSALALAGWPIARSGLVNLWRNHTFNINFLMTIAGIGAVVIGEYLEAASLILLFNIAEALESFTNIRARGELSKLKNLTPTHAIKLEGEYESRLPLEELAINDTILIRPGERIPLDGEIIEGQSAIDQSPITGESIPVWKEVGNRVYSGSVNGNGRIIINVTRLAGDSTLHRIIQMVTEAQSQQSKSQKFIDKFAHYYTPAMVILAILVATIPTVLFGEPFFNLPDGSYGWLHRALVLLVIGCPCALVISTPVTMVASLAKAAKEGVLFKGGVFMEALAKMKVFAFDKTGTLTQGQPRVVESRDLACQGEVQCESCDDLLALAYALERHASHPLAQAIIEEAEKRGLTDCYPPASAGQTRGGLGLEGEINGRLVTIGNLRLFKEEHDIPPIVLQWVKQAESNGKTAMLLCDGQRVRGFIAVADTPRDESQAVISALKANGKTTVMLTGDNDTVAHAVGGKLGLDDVRANLLPGGKLEAIHAMQGQFGKVAMVGDGINDAPALAAADLGIAMGGVGRAQAMETADVVLMADGLHQLPFALKLSRFANQLIKQNISVSLGSKLLVAVIAFLGFAPLWLAVIADMGVSLLVTLNGLRAARFKA